MLATIYKLIENLWVSKLNRPTDISRNDQVASSSNADIFIDLTNDDEHSQPIPPINQPLSHQCQNRIPAIQRPTKASVLDKIITSNDRQDQSSKIIHSFRSHHFNSPNSSRYSSPIISRKRLSNSNSFNETNGAQEFSQEWISPIKRRCLTYPVHRKTERDVFACLIKLYTDPSQGSHGLSLSNGHVGTENNSEMGNVLSQTPQLKKMFEPVAASTVLKKPNVPLENGDYLNERETERSVKNKHMPRFRDVYEAAPYVRDNYLDTYETDCFKEKWKRQTVNAEAEAKFWAAKRLQLQQENVDNISKKLNRLLRERPVIEDVFLSTLPELEIDVRDETPELDREMRQLICDKLRGPENSTVSHAFKLTFTVADLKTLCGLTWLSDQVINFYLQLIQARSEAYSSDVTDETDYQMHTPFTRSPLPTVVVVNTFFYPKLRQSGFDSVKRWTRRSNIFKKDLFFIPIHLGIHWCMLCVDLRKKSVTYYDSMGGKNFDCLHNVMNFLEKESLDKEGQHINVGEWQLLHATNYPQQHNGADCGVFSCVCAEHLSRDRKLDFCQDQMPYFRQKIQFEILQKTLISPI